MQGILGRSSLEEDRVTCLEKLANVVEPETGLPIVNLGLVRVNKNENGEIVISYYPISAYTSPILVISVGLEIAKECNGIRVVVENYYLKDEINKRLEVIRNELSRLLGKAIT